VSGTLDANEAPSTSRVGDDHDIGASDEEPGLDDAGDRA
jgi:hypothetical protein